MSSAINLLPLRRLRRSAARVNAPLLAGLLLVAVLAACAVGAPLLAPYDPLQTIFRYRGDAIIPAPYPPGTPGMALGSDTLWRDMLSRLIYGSRYTLLFCGVAALARVVLGGLAGMLMGWYGRAERALGVVVGVWSAVPSLFMAIMPIVLANRATRDEGAATLVFVAALSLTGWAEIAVRCRVAVAGLKGEPFVEAAYAIGLSRARVLWRHILPNLRELLVVEAAYAMGAVLLLVAEMAFLGVVLGGAARETSADTAGTTRFAEWGSMLATGARERGAGIWLLLEPLLAFSLAILAFNLLAEGLRRKR
jgi:peptide/nickel transport system permease protein